MFDTAVGLNGIACVLRLGPAGPLSMIDVVAPSLLQSVVLAATLFRHAEPGAEHPSRSTHGSGERIVDGASVYILRCNDGSFYVGVRQRSVEERVSEHNSGLAPGYTSHRRPVELLFSEHDPRVINAIEAEKRIKGWSRAKKVAYMTGSFDALQRFARGPRARASFDSVAARSFSTDMEE